MTGGELVTQLRSPTCIALLQDGGEGTEVKEFAQGVAPLLSKYVPD